MATTPILAEKTFSAADQERFAALSGDRNPMHMDAVAARRTLAGAPVVHGIHTLLWALNAWCAGLERPVAIAALKVSFGKMTYVGECVALVVSRHDAERAVLTAQVGAVGVLTATLGFGAPEAGGPTVPGGPEREPAEPETLAFERMGEAYGSIPCSAALGEEAARLFPAAAAALGPERLAGLIRSSYLVGMVCPGLHSIFSGLTLRAAEIEDAEALHFAATGADARFRRVTLGLSGAGWSGSLDAYARPEPTGQPALSTIAGQVVPGEFAGSSVLVVGGSRGLGELVAKIAAAGGAAVTLTYDVGEDDARRVRDEICDAGGLCGILRYDVRAEPATQLRALARAPDALYYFATPPIFRRRGPGLQRDHLAEFLAFYVTGFHDLCRDLKAHFGRELSIFYPSSVAVETRPAGMTEYAMAKAAAEILCADLQAQPDRPGPILLRRLPRLATDQTATLVQAETADALATLLPIVRAVQAARPAPR